jgi:hypothetical protein
MFAENFEQEKDSLKSEVYEPKILVEVRDKLGSSLYIDDSKRKEVKKEIA